MTFFLWFFQISQIVDLDFPNTTESYKLYCQVCYWSWCYLGRVHLFYRADCSFATESNCKWYQGMRMSCSRYSIWWSVILPSVLSSTTFFFFWVLAFLINYLYHLLTYWTVNLLATFFHNKLLFDKMKI